MPTPELLAEAPGETSLAEVLELIPFASRSTPTSSAIQPTQGQPECSAEGDSLMVAGSLLPDPRMASQVVVGLQVISST